MLPYSTKVETDTYQSIIDAASSPHVISISIRQSSQFNKGLILMSQRLDSNVYDFNLKNVIAKVVERFQRSCRKLCA